MSRRITFISDFFSHDLAFGGAEASDQNLMERLEERGVIFDKINCSLVTPKILKTIDNTIIISNFTQLSTESMQELTQGGYDYHIYEHDHKYVADRNPGKYKDFLVPSSLIINKDFYSGAKSIMCQSKMHLNILSKNLNLDNCHNLKCSLWSKEEILKIREKSIHKTKRVAVLKSGNPIKNQIGAENFCRERNLEYDLISAPNPSELLEKLSSYETLVYLPLVPESFCRLVVEAKMVGCKVITNKFVGATSESWFSGSREQIIDSVDSLQDEIVEFFNDKLLSENSGEKEEGTHFKIIVPFYNAEQWIKRCIKSIQEQNYDNFQCVIVDDCSTDSSHQVVVEAIGDDDRFTFVSNDKNVGALENIVNAIKLSQPGDEDVIVTLDGDDWFSHNMTLSLVNSYYTDNKCWLTYGSYYEYPSIGW